MKIVLVSGSFTPNLCGIAHYSARIAEELAQRGEEVTVVTTKQAQRSFGRSANFDVLGAVDNWSSAELPNLLIALGRLYPDIIHFQHSASSYGQRPEVGIIPLMVRLSRWKARVVTTAHEYGGQEMKHSLLPAALVNKAFGFIERHGIMDREDLFLLTFSDKVIATDEYHFKYIGDRIPPLRRKLELLPIGPNVLPTEGNRDDIRSEARERWGVEAGAPFVVYFGFIQPVKGLETLVEAFARLKGEQPGAKLVLAGGVESLALKGEDAESYRRKLEGQIEAMGLRESAQLTGFLASEEVSKLLLAADLCVLPFNSGISLKSGSLMAALAHGLPVIATRGESVVPELVDGENVLLVPPLDSGALATAISALLSSDPLRDKLARGGLSLADSFSWEGIIDRHLRIYAELGRA